MLETDVLSYVFFDRSNDLFYVQMITFCTVRLSSLQTLQLESYLRVNSKNKGKLHKRRKNVEISKTKLKFIGIITEELELFRILRRVHLK